MTNLTNGIVAPEFSVSDIGDELIELKNFRGKKVMLSFYRYASCPLCNLRINDLIRQYPNLKGKGLEMIAVFQSPKSSILEYVGKQDAPFPIVPDPEQKLYQLYHVSGDWGKFALGLVQPKKIFNMLKRGYLPGKMENDINMIPADFLIDEKGFIHTAYYGKDASDHLDMKVIEDFLNL
jgi:peroxiredoxin Q/BCP